MNNSCKACKCLWLHFLLSQLLRHFVYGNTVNKWEVNILCISKYQTDSF